MTSPHNHPSQEGSRFNTERINLSPYIAQIENDTFTISPSLSSSILQKLIAGVLILPQPALNKMWDDLKIERNARIAFLTRVVMARLGDKFTAIEQLVEARLRHKTSFEAVPRLTTVFLDELADVAQNKHSEPDEVLRTRTRQSVLRLQDIVLFGGKYGMWANTQQLYTPQIFIFRGFNTATGFLVSFYQMLVKTYSNNDIPLTSENIQKGIKSALQHMHLFASFNVAHGPGLIDGLQNPPTTDSFEAFSEKYFTFDKERMRFSPKMDAIRAIKLPHEPRKVLEHKPDGPTTGCPVSFTPTDFDMLATVYAKLLGTYVETMTESELANSKRAVRNFLVSIS